MIDHIQGNPLNNCRCNLRVCTRAENMRNRAPRVDSASRFKGVRYSERAGRWYARLCFQGQRIFLGWFATALEAARAYDRGAVRWFREYARLNFPEEWPPERRAEVYAQNLQPPPRKKKAKRSKGKKATHRKTENGGQKTDGGRPKARNRKRKAKAESSRREKATRERAENTGHRTGRQKRKTKTGGSKGNKDRHTAL